MFYCCCYFYYRYTHTHTRLVALCPGLKLIWILLKPETVSGSGISWAICKSAPRSRLITTPAPYHSVFLQAGCPFCRQTNSVKPLALLLCIFLDGLVKKLEEMEKTAGNYRNLMEHTRRLLRAFFNLSQAHRGDCPQTRLLMLCTGSPELTTENCSQ